MSDTFKFWTHGVAVIPEYTKEYTGTDNGLFIRRAGWGAQVRQYGETDNWFHFAIPSATELDDDGVSYFHAWLRVRVNNDAVIDRIHLREATGPQTNSTLIHDTGNINITGRDLELDFNLPDRQCKGPLVMSIHVRFDTHNGEVVFAGVGGWFEEWT